MERTLYAKLKEWKNSPHRMPLMLYGARQVGKTYLLKEFGEKEFDNMVYINCYKNADIESLFKADKDIKRILRGLSALSGEEIVPGDTFIFLDEAQEVPDVIGSLKYFCEDEPQCHIAVAGSLLGILNMEGVSFPTGKVDIMHLYPMTFMEFLNAMGLKKLIDVLEAEDYDTVKALSSTFENHLRQYYFVGGMPAAVKEYVESENLGEVRLIQNNILAAYEADISKHAGKEAVKARMIFQSIPSQLAKDNSRFLFGALKTGSRGADYENSIQWLLDAGLIYKVPHLSKAAIPLSFYSERNRFKLYMLDVGLLGAMAKLPAAMMLIGNSVFSDYKGAFTENYVLTQLVTLGDIDVGYYTKEKSTLEIDFILQHGSRLFPIEVKAEENVKSKSLRQFITVDNKDTGLRGYRLSMKGLERQDWMTNIPLYAVLPFFRNAEGE